MRATLINVARLAAVVASLSAAPSPFAQGATAAQIVTGAQAVESARALDGTLVAYQGELIGEAMRRGDHVWLNLADRDGVLGIWIGSDIIPAGLVGGGWKSRGDTLKVTGIFHRACAEHGGDLDLHAVTVALVRRGEVIAHPVAPWKGALAVAMAVLAAILAMVSVRRSRSRARALPGARRGRGAGV